VPLAQVVTDERQLGRVGPREFSAPPTAVERIRLPRGGNPRQKDYRREIAHALRGLDPPWVDLDDLDGPGGREGGGNGDADEQRSGPSEAVSILRSELRAHPCHSCPDRAEHERWQYRADELLDKAEGLRRSIQRATGSLVRQLHRILGVLGELGYVDETPRPTDRGLMLAGIYSEVDLLVAEALRRGLLDDLEPAELAGVAALFLYEPRGGDPTEDPELPTLALFDAVEDVLDLADELRSLERQTGVKPLRDLDAGFVAPAWRWASGADLDEALGDLELTGGDFVRNVKQVADLVGQLREVGGAAVGPVAREAVDALRRGIVEA
jgi:ATP-dependent RNA helicase HelY